MKSSKYLNTVLTVIAVLLWLNLWVGAHQSPTGAALDMTEQAHAAGRTDSGQQRARMIEELSALGSKMDGMNKKLSDGSIKVQVQGLPNKD